MERAKGQKSEGEKTDRLRLNSDKEQINSIN